MAYTSCALTTGFDLDCRDAVGGVKSVRLASLEDYEAMAATVAAGAITGFGSAALEFFKYDQLKETSSLTETINGSSQNGTVYYTPEVVIVLSKLDVTKRNEIKVLAQQVVNQALNTPRVVVPSSSVHVWTVFDGDGAPGFTFAFDKGIVHVV